MFRYFADPLCIICCLAYVVNRFLLKPHWHSGFFHGYFNDVLLIPCALPLVLWLQRRLGLRQHDRKPDAIEIAFHLVIWSVLFEGIGPFLFRHVTGDWWDVAAYASGGVIAWIYWNGLRTAEHAPASFDGLAPYYLWMERLLAGKRLQRCREAYLPQTRARSVLVLGPGRGLFVERFLQSNQEASMVCVDSSARMLTLTRDRIVRSVENPERVVFVRADVLDDQVDWLEENDSFDLVVSHFFLDCFGTAELEKVISKVSACTAPSASWLIADFCIPRRGFWRWRAEAVLWMAYTFFRRTTGISAKRLVNPEPALQRWGFALEQRRGFDFGLLRSDVWRKGSPVVASTA